MLCMAFIAWTFTSNGIIVASPGTLGEENRSLRMPHVEHSSTSLAQCPYSLPGSFKSVTVYLPHSGHIDGKLGSAVVCVLFRVDAQQLKLALCCSLRCQMHFCITGDRFALATFLGRKEHGCPRGLSHTHEALADELLTLDMPGSSSELDPTESPGRPATFQLREFCLKRLVQCYVSLAQLLSAKGPSE